VTNTSSISATEATCNDDYAKCGGSGWEGTDSCCADDMLCYKKDESYSECKKSCPEGWSCTEAADASTDLDSSSYSYAYEDTCIGSFKMCDGTGFSGTESCCDESYDCMKQDETYSECRESCPEGWDCETETLSTLSGTKHNKHHKHHSHHKSHHSKKSSEEPVAQVFSMAYEAAHLASQEFVETSELSKHHSHHAHHKNHRNSKHSSEPRAEVYSMAYGAADLTSASKDFARDGFTLEDDEK